MKQLALFAKYWQPGCVKTRLAEDIGSEFAAEFHRLALLTVARRMGPLAGQGTVVFTPRQRQSHFEQLLGPDWQYCPQRGADLGERLADYVVSAFAAAPPRGTQRRRLVILGADSPTLSVELVRRAFQVLSVKDSVVVPSDDGGYCLIGLSGPHVKLFDHQAWGTDAAMQATLALAQRCRIGIEVLSPWFDIDHVGDLRRLASELSRAALRDGSPLDELAEFVRRVLASQSSG